MVIVNVDYITEKEIEVIELIQGSGIGHTVDEAYKEALSNLEKAAEKIRAEAIINVKLDHTIREDQVSLLVYGTAVRYHVCYELQQF